MTTEFIARGPANLRAVHEAFQKFGPTRPENAGAIGRWVQLRVAELTGQTTAAAAKAAQPQLFDDEIVEPEHRTE